MIYGSLKNILPRSLFGRALMILVLPTLLIQLMATYVFYERHWENVSRWMASSLAGEVALLVHELNDAEPEDREKLMALAKNLMSIRIMLDDKRVSERFGRKGEAVSPIFFRELEARLSMPFAVGLTEDGQELVIRVKLHDAVLRIEVTRKRLVSATTYIFVMWLFGSSVLLLGVAMIFLRNQIRPIAKLATAMDDFGRGHEVAVFRPQGADEVRRAGRAFLSMKQRLERQISARMEMLAGISHDLRTPLTRMKLELEMLKDTESATAIRRDVQDMEHMIEEYLDFVRGEGQEAPKRVRLAECLRDMLQRYNGQQAEVTFDAKGQDAVEVEIRPLVFHRAMLNLVENALRYGKTCHITLAKRHQHVEVVMDDAGPGIPAAQREAVFQPFTRLDHSRNSHTGGVGLGLAIARDIIHAHGGIITLRDAADGGLRVIVRLPIAGQIKKREP